MLWNLAYLVIVDITFVFLLYTKLTPHKTRESHRRNNLCGQHMSDESEAWKILRNEAHTKSLGCPFYLHFLSIPPLDLPHQDTEHVPNWMDLEWQ